MIKIREIKNMYSKGVFLNIVSKDKKNWKKQIDFINSLGNVNHIEVWLEENLTLLELKFLKSLLKKYDIVIHGPWAHLSLVSPHKEIREISIKLYLQTLRVAEILGAKLVTFHCGTRIKFLSKGAAIKLLIQNLKKIKHCYKGKSIFIIENDPPGPPKKVYQNFPSSLQEMSYLKKSLPWLNFTLDVGHTLQSNDNLDKISKFVKKYKDSILDIHLHDAVLKGEAHLVLGKGDLDVKAFFNLLNRINYNKYVTLETIGQEDTKKSWKKILKL